MEIKDYVTPLLLNSKIFKAIFEVQQSEIDSSTNLIKEIVNQFFVDTATWGLKYWEEFLGITIDETRPFDYRRSVIKSKLRGSGTVTVGLIKNVAESFSNGEVEVIENIAPYTFEVKFVGTRGIPPNLEDLKKAIGEIKPAHLAVNYEFSYLLIKDIDKVMTINQIQNTKLNLFAGGI